MSSRKWSSVSRAVAGLAVVALIATGSASVATAANAAKSTAPQQLRLSLSLDGKRFLELATANAGRLVGWPALPQTVVDRTGIVLDPEYWFTYVQRVLTGTILLPVPIDPVKPELALPTAPVHNGAYVSALPDNPQDLSTVEYTWQGQTRTVADFQRDYYTNGWSADLRHQPWSVTKSFVSTLIGIARDEGRLGSVAEPIDTYLPELRGTAWAGVTIQNLLEMESGVEWDEENPVLALNTQVQQWAELGLDRFTHGLAGKSRNEFLKSLRRVEPQGTTFHYNSGNTQVPTWLLETRYGQSFAQLLSEKLWQPAGMAGDALVMTDRAGDAVASQGLYARSHDFARLGELFRHNGTTAEGNRVVAADWVREATVFTGVSGGRYGYQWWQGATPDGFSAVGFQGNRITVSPANCLTGVRLSHTLSAQVGSGGAAIDDGGEEWNAVYRAVATRLGGCG